jgi:hypothetical protein
MLGIRSFTNIPKPNLNFPLQPIGCQQFFHSAFASLSFCNNMLKDSGLLAQGPQVPWWGCHIWPRHWPFNSLTLVSGFYVVEHFLCTFSCVWLSCHIPGWHSSFVITGLPDHWSLWRLSFGHLTHRGYIWSL